MPGCLKLERGREVVDLAKENKPYPPSVERLDSSNLCLLFLHMLADESLYSCLYACCLASSQKTQHAAAYAFSDLLPVFGFAHELPVARVREEKSF